MKRRAFEEKHVLPLLAQHDPNSEEYRKIRLMFSNREHFTDYLISYIYSPVYESKDYDTFIERFKKYQYLINFNYYCSPSILSALLTCVDDGKFSDVDFWNTLLKENPSISYQGFPILAFLIDKIDISRHFYTRNKDYFRFIKPLWTIVKAGHSIKITDTHIRVTSGDYGVETVTYKVENNVLTINVVDGTKNFAFAIENDYSIPLTDVKTIIVTCD